MFLIKKIILGTFVLLLMTSSLKSQNISKLKKKLEIKKLKSDNYPKSEIFFGINLNTNFGSIQSTENSLNLRSANIKFDNYIPSLNLGFKYLLNPKKHHGFFVQINHYSGKALKFNNSNSFIPVFQNAFNEIRTGIIYGRLLIGYGKYLEKQISQEEMTEINRFNNLSLNYTIYRSNRLKNPLNIKDYWSLSSSINYISDFKELNYINFSLGFKYHFSFNRKLSLKDKIWLKKRDFN